MDKSPNFIPRNNPLSTSHRYVKIITFGVYVDKKQAIQITAAILDHPVSDALRHIDISLLWKNNFTPAKLSIFDFFTW